MKTFITAMLAAASLVGAASADTTGAYTVISSTETASIGDYVTLSLYGDGSFTSMPATWNNTTALQVMNEDLGINATAGDLSSYFAIFSTIELALTFSSEAYKVGDEVTIYLLLGAEASSIFFYAYESSGLTVTSVSVAYSSSDSDFSPADYSDPMVVIPSSSDTTVLVKLTGTLSGKRTDASGNYVVILMSESTNQGFGLVAVSGAAAVPEPATATLSLLALAGLAARRRRK